MDKWLEEFSQYYNEFITWFSGMEIAAQIITGILIILLCIGIGYLTYGILWFTVQVVKASIIANILMMYLGYIVVKLIIVAIVESESNRYGEDMVKKEWDNSVRNIKWFLNKMYPSSGDCCESNSIKIQDDSHKNSHEPSQVIIIKDNPQYHCTQCGTEFTDRMKKAMKDKNYAFCEACGQMFVLPDTIQDKVPVPSG